MAQARGGGGVVATLRWTHVGPRGAGAVAPRATRRAAASNFAATAPGHGRRRGLRIPADRRAPPSSPSGASYASSATRRSRSRPPACFAAGSTARRRSGSRCSRTASTSRATTRCAAPSRASRSRENRPRGDGGRRSSDGRVRRRRGRCSTVWAPSRARSGLPPRASRSRSRRTADASTIASGASSTARSPLLGEGHRERLIRSIFAHPRRSLPRNRG